MKPASAFFHSAVVCAVFTASIEAARAQEHPMDPLTFGEYWTVLEVLQAEDRLNSETAFYNVSLVEPGKASVWSFSDGDAFERKAKAVVGQNGQTAEAVIDLNRRTLESWSLLEGVQPNWLGREFGAASGAIKQHLVRAEDWPVMPIVWHTFELRPFDFFDRNPALDLPE